MNTGSGSKYGESVLALKTSRRTDVSPCPSLFSNAYTPVNAQKINGTKVEFYGNVHLPKDIPTVQAIVRNKNIYNGYWFRFKGEGLEWEGTPDINAGWIECESAWGAQQAGEMSTG